MNMVNRKFAVASTAAQPALVEFLVQVFKPLFPHNTAAEVDRMAAHMGRHVSPTQNS